MKLFLHTPQTDSELLAIYQRAFSEASELFIVSAYLTEWDSSLKLGNQCKHFRIIIGKDFGITRKHACEAVMKWLQKSKIATFKVADSIAGFHPKAIFWRDSQSKCHSLVGSSNLTRAAFENNYEANIYGVISESNYLKARAWIGKIDKLSVVVSEDWLLKYQESTPGKAQEIRKAKGRSGSPVVSLPLPRPAGMIDLLRRRRVQLRAYEEHKKELFSLFQECANGQITSLAFYDKLPSVWSVSLDNRLQGFGFEIRGKHSNFQELAKSFNRIVEANDNDRDDVVREEIDRLAEIKIPTRAAFLSEMLCLAFPREYPILNAPVRKYISSIKFKAPRGATEGTVYIDLASKLRASLVQNIGYPAKNLAEIDTLIWDTYGN